MERKKKLNTYKITKCTYQKKIIITKCIHIRSVAFVQRNLLAKFTFLMKREMGFEDHKWGSGTCGLHGDKKKCSSFQVVIIKKL